MKVPVFWQRALFAYILIVSKIMMFAVAMIHYCIVMVCVSPTINIMIFYAVRESCALAVVSYGNLV
jgi:hypothetical protein